MNNALPLSDFANTSLTAIEPTKKKKAPLIKAQSSGLIERCLVVGGGLCAVYTFAATLPIASGAALVAMGAYFWGEIENFQSRETAEELKLILESRTPKHSSINDVKKSLKKQFSTEVLNDAIEGMLGNTGYVAFKPTDDHPLAKFGECYCWINPLDPMDVKLPLQRIEQLLKDWEIIPTIEAGAIAATTEPASAQSSTPPNDPHPIARLMHFFRLQNTLLWGGQGSGKTSLTRAIAADKLAHNQKVIVLNPHGSAATWQGMRLIGGGKDYKAVEEFMRSYLALVKKRYQLFEQSGISEDDFLEQLLKAGLVESVICEEASSWAANVDQELLHDFTRTGLTESRKVGLPLLIVTHDPSLEFMGLKKGARLRDAGMAIVELEPGIADLDTGFLKATGKGKLQLPGQKDAIAFVFEAPNPIPSIGRPGAAPPGIGSRFAADIENLISSPALTPKKIEQIANAYGLPMPEIPRSAKQQLEDVYKLNVAVPTVITEVEPTAIAPIEALLIEYADDPKTAAFLKWIASKPTGEVITREQIQSSYWAKQNGRDKATLDRVLIEAMSARLLIEIDGESYQKKDI